MKRFLPIAMLLVSALGFAQKAESGTACPCPQRNSITVHGESVFETDPDVAVISLTISTQERQLKDAYARATRAADQIREAMRANGIDPKEAQIGFFQVAPVYDYGKKRKAVAFGVQSKITLKLRDFAKIPALIDALTAIDVTGEQNVSYQISDLAAAKNKAIVNATENAQHIAESVAKTAGVNLGDLIGASVETQIARPVSRSRSYSSSETVEVTSGYSTDKAPAPTADFGAGKVTVNANVNLEFAIR
jgi:uncharacterized protein